MKRKITDSQRDQLAEIVELAKNCAGASILPMPPEIHAQQLGGNMGVIARNARALYVELTGQDPWAH